MNMFKDDTVITILETPKEKELRALRQIATDRQHWYYVRLQRQKEQDFVWDLLREIKANLPRQSGGALFCSGSMNLGGAVPTDLQVWKVPDGTPSY